MRRLLVQACLLFLGFFALPALADKLAAVVPLADDDLAAVDRIRAVPEKHVFLYFGDDLN